VLYDRVVGPFLAHSAEHCFVIVDQLGDVCGYVLTAPNANSFCDSVANKWLPYLQQKYPLPDASADQSAVMVLLSYHTIYQNVPLIHRCEFQCSAKTLILAAQLCHL